MTVPDTAFIRSELETRIKPNATFLGTYEIRSAIKEMSSSSSTVLELAATAYWLRHDEGVPDWKAELLRRKGQKADRGRLEEALRLLEKIGLRLDV